MGRGQCNMNVFLLICWIKRKIATIVHDLTFFSVCPWTKFLAWPGIVLPIVSLHIHKNKFAFQHSIYELGLT